MLILFMLAMLVLIVFAAEVFVNALEHLGERLKISEGVTGSLFAAVGTAMPETMVPILAIFAGTDNQTLNHEIGVGAILGAPLMLVTFAMGLLTVVSWRARGGNALFTPEPTGIRRDLNFFLAAFSLAAVALFVPRDYPVVRLAIGLGLVLVYFIYILLTLRASANLVENGHGTEAGKPMLLARLGLPPGMPVILLQMILGLALLVAGAKGFIHGVEATAAWLGMSALLLSLIIVPIATELPEKVNSVLWIRRRKDTLAFGNLTGAMVFQGTLLPAIGIMLTPWDPRIEVLAGVVITLAGALWLRVLLARGALRVWHLAVNGGLYGVYLMIALS
ncbi:MAG: sodium:calcium antiporter [Pseudomonadota bacterium]